MDHSIEYERLVSLYETTYGESDSSVLSQTLNQLVSDLNCLTSAEPQNAEALHLLGLCWYETPEDSADRERQAENAFRQCLAIDPEHQYANLFLGHVLFDMRRYEEALERFVKVDPDYFEARGQQWRIVKNDELQLCCRFELRPASVSFWELDALCQRYEIDPILPVPAEIVSCIGQLTERGELPLGTIASLCFANSQNAPTNRPPEGCVPARVNSSTS